jgi:hypothetical protein
MALENRLQFCDYFITQALRSKQGSFLGTELSAEYEMSKLWETDS